MSSLRAKILDALNGWVVRRAAHAWGLRFVVEYPKCGGSWAVSMLRACAGVRHRRENEAPLARGDVLKRHETHRDTLRPAIVMVRDPRDVWVSFYFHERHVIPNPELFAACGDVPGAPEHENLFRYMRRKHAFPAESPPGFSYADFLRSWTGRPGTLRVRYEDVQADPEGELRRMCAFLGIAADDTRVREAVEANRFSSVSGRPRGVEDPTQHKRKGIVGDWRNHFTAEMSEWVRANQGELLEALGYG